MEQKSAAKRPSKGGLSREVPDDHEARSQGKWQERKTVPQNSERGDADVHEREAISSARE